MVLVATGRVEKGIPSGKVGWAWRVNGNLSIANEWEAKLKEKPSTRVWVGWAFAWLLLILPATPWAQTRYPATLVRVIDGDTYVLRVDLPFAVSYTATVRLAGLDTPERTTDAGKQARVAAERLLRSGRIEVAPTGKMTFARHVAQVYVGGQSVADVLAQAGFKKPAPP